MTNHPAGPLDALRAEEQGLLACVHCGFCLNACPTYTRLGHEGDSPRGRLDLMRAAIEGRIAPDDPAFRLHIDRCLGCRACEPVCPSGVPYGFLLERARAAIARSSGVSFSTRVLIASFTGPLRPLVVAGSRLLRATGVARLLVRLLPARLAAVRFALAMLASSAAWPKLRRGHPAGSAGYGPAPIAPPQKRSEAGPRSDRIDRPGGEGSDVLSDPARGFAKPHSLAGGYPDATAAGIRSRTEPGGGQSGGDGTEETGARTAETGRHEARPAERAGRARRVAILEGCVQASLFARVNAATERVLVANGYDVIGVRAQRCCGALDAHAGRLQMAEELARANIEAFEKSGAELIVVNAAGCGAIMKEYAEQLKHDEAWSDRAAAFSGRVRDVAELLVEGGIRRGGSLPLRVTYDAPCHLHHGQRIRQAPLDLLDAIPDLERIPLPDAEECCGGAGLYGVHHQELGGRILGDKVAAIRSTGADVVTTPNPGCMMQIGAGLLLANVDVAVVHPLELLDESYRRQGEGTV